MSAEWRDISSSNYFTFSHFQLINLYRILSTIFSVRSSVSRYSRYGGIIIFKRFYLSTVMGTLWLTQGILVGVLLVGHGGGARVVVVMILDQRVCQRAERVLHKSPASHCIETFFYNFLVWSNVLLKFEIGCKTEKVSKFHTRNGRREILVLWGQKVVSKSK